MVKSEIQNPQSPIRNPKSPIQNPKLALLAKPCPWHCEAEVSKIQNPMSTPHDLLDIPIDATPAMAKTAYHAKLREFPAHTHPTEFKAIRSAYEAIKNGITAPTKSFFQPQPIGMSIEPAIIDRLTQNLITHLEVSLEDLLRETF
jgi:hypothetical protein